MGYQSNRNKPFEMASKSQHTHVIKDEVVQKLLAQCKFPSTADDASSDVIDTMLQIENDESSTIHHIVAIDGGYTETTIRKSYPSSKLAFLQFGALLFKLSDLKDLGNKPFIDPEDMAKFKELERYKLALPTKSLSISNLSMLNTVREALILFFNEPRTTTSFMDSLKWFLFHEYKSKGPEADGALASIKLGSLPQYENPAGIEIIIPKKDIQKDGSFLISGKTFNLIDVFRFHEVVDEELGASGILGYLTNVIEHIVIVHCIRELYNIQPSKISRFLFIKDGPLGFFGQTAKLHKDMRELCNYFIPKYGLKLVGLEKSGTFVEHAEQITKGEQAPLRYGNILLLNNNYIYKHILPGPSTDEELKRLPIYANSSYYSGKLIYNSHSGRTWVITIPIADSEIIKSPKIEDYKNLPEILFTLDKLKCDMYDNAIVPIALVNQLVSLANHPSSKILEKFAKSSIGD